MGWRWANWESSPNEGGAFGEPTYFAHPSDPVFHIECTESWGCIDRSNSSLNYTDAGVRVPLYVEVEASPDKHISVIDQDIGFEWDFWHVQALVLDPLGHNVIRVGSAGQVPLGSSGTGHGTTASWFANIAGRIRAEEMMAGEIKHALFLTTYCTSDNGWTNDAGYTFPAFANDLFCEAVLPDGGLYQVNGEWAPHPGGGISHPDDVPMGALFALDRTEAQIDAMNLAPWKKVVLKAMAKYGMYVGDTGVRQNALELETGMQYLACGYSDRWLQWMESEVARYPDGGHGFEPYVPGTPGVQRWVGKLQEGSEQWVPYLKMVDPCWAQGTCPP